MSIILILFIVLNLLISPFNIAFAAIVPTPTPIPSVTPAPTRTVTPTPTPTVTPTVTTPTPTLTPIAIETQNLMRMEVVSYKIGNRIIETRSSTNIGVASMEPKVVPELSNQPIIKVKSELSSDQANRKIILKINIENIGNVEAKNIKAVMQSEPTADVLYVKGGRVSREEATWTGEIDPSISQELVYELQYKGDATEDLTIPLTISGSGSYEWILEIIFIILQWWLKIEFGIEIPSAAPTPGFEIVLGVSSLIVISYLLSKKFKNL